MEQNLNGTMTLKTSSHMLLRPLDADSERLLYLQTGESARTITLTREWFTIGDTSWDQHGDDRMLPAGSRVRLIRQGNASALSQIEVEEQQ